VTSGRAEELQALLRMTWTSRINCVNDEAKALTHPDASGSSRRHKPSFDAVPMKTSDRLIDH